MFGDYLTLCGNVEYFMGLLGLNVVLTGTNWDDENAWGL
jgi:hypothetical protein